MSANTSNVLATADNFDVSQLDLEIQARNISEDNPEREQDEILNIGEFVFNHITAESTGTFLKSIRRKVAIYSKCLIKT
jgi:hypothetical protein